MNQTNQLNNRDQRRDQFEEETELIDYLRVMWKWKWLIIGGTLVCVLGVSIYGSTRPVARIYKVSALIEIDRNLIEIDPEAKLNPLDKIKSMIEYGIFNQQILNDLSNLQVEGISNPGSLAFEVNIPKGLNTLDIAYKTPDVDLGKAVLNSLIKQLGREYREKIEQTRFQFDENIKEKNRSIKNIQVNIEQIKLVEGNKIFSVNSSIKNIQVNIQLIETVTKKTVTN